MSIHTIPTTDPTMARRLVASGVLLASAFVLAEGNTRLEAPPLYDQILSDDIYERAEGWREPAMDGEEWRTSKPEPRSRIRFGYDSAYEELRARDETRYSSKPINQGDVQPSTQINLGF